MTTYHRRHPNGPLCRDIRPGDLVTVGRGTFGLKEPDRFVDEGPTARETTLGLALAVVTQTAHSRLRDGSLDPREHRMKMYVDVVGEEQRDRRTVLAFLFTGELVWFDENQISYFYPDEDTVHGARGM